MTFDVQSGIRVGTIEFDFVCQLLYFDEWKGLVSLAC